MITGIVSSSAFRRRFSPDCPGWKVPILFADNVGNVGGREAELRHPGRVQDQAHRVILSAEDQCVSDATQSFEIIDYVEERVVRRRRPYLSWGRWN